mgnify:CR=1 FL=1
MVIENELILAESVLFLLKVKKTFFRLAHLRFIIHSKTTFFLYIIFMYLKLVVDESFSFVSLFQVDDDPS